MNAALRDVLDLLLDDRAAGVGIGRALRAIARMHRRSQGSVNIFFLIIMIVLYACAAMVFNTGYVIAGRLQAQNAADSAAYTAAMWNSRCMNVVTATNMLILRNAAAHVAATGAVAVGSTVPSIWNARINSAPTPAERAARLAQRAVEFPYWQRFMSERFPTAAAAVADQRFLRRIDELYAFQRQWIDQTPILIEQERVKLEQYYGMRIRLTRPIDGAGTVRPPLVPGTPVSFTRVLALRMVHSDGGLPQDAEFAMWSQLGNAQGVWAGSTATSIISTSISQGFKHHVLTTQIGPVEPGPSTVALRAPFSVFATVQNSNVSSAGLMAQGIFRWPINPLDSCLAYAQAETYNSLDERLRMINFSNPWPFRVWSDWGWTWQPRLALGDQIRNAMNGDAETQAFFRNIGVRANDEATLRFIAIH
jgi:hypothetical protein